MQAFLCLNSHIYRRYDFSYGERFGEIVFLILYTVQVVIIGVLRGIEHFIESACVFYRVTVTWQRDEKCE